MGVEWTSVWLRMEVDGRYLLRLLGVVVTMRFAGLLRGAAALGGVGVLDVGARNVLGGDAVDAGHEWLV